MQSILDVSGLGIAFGNSDVLCDLTFSVERRKTLAIVGESGSGKSVTSLAIMGLLGHVGGRVTHGDIHLHSDAGDVDIVNANAETLRRVRGNRVAMIFQEPMTSLDPVFSVGSQICEVLKTHRNLSGQAAKAEAARLLDLVRLPNARAMLNSFPHQLSGGMRQRVMIAMAVSCNPELLIADEPTTALDVTTQAQILQIIRDMQAEFGTSTIFITHDMGIVSQMADDIVILKSGNMVERGKARDVLLNPQTDYARGLMAAVPRIGAMRGRDSPCRFDLPDERFSDIDKPRQPSDSPLIVLKDVTARYNVRSGFWGRVRHRVHAAESINLAIRPGETVALVGESGSGKSTVGKTLQQLITPVSGKILFNGTDILSLDPVARRQFKRDIQYVFQDPFGSLNPRKTIMQSLSEPMATHGMLTDPKKQVADLLISVGLLPKYASRYPHEFSGGERQRICIARALSVKPKLIIADEAVSALDVSIQAQVINLLMRLQEERGLAYLFISHNMAIVERISHRVAVMFLGQIVETGTRRQVFENPQHPYTRRLLQAVPVIDPDNRPARVNLDRDVPSPIKAIDDPFNTHGFIEVSPGHLLADDYRKFNKRWEAVK